VAASDGFLHIPDLYINLANVALASEDYDDALRLYKVAMSRLDANKQSQVWREGVCVGRGHGPKGAKGVCGAGQGQEGVKGVYGGGKGRHVKEVCGSWPVQKSAKRVCGGGHGRRSEWPGLGHR
jgi:hypothetical protein